MSKNEWDEIYKRYKLNEIPWHSSQPDRYLSQLIREKKVEKGLVLDLCSGDGTNSIYLASRGFRVIGIDISPHAVEIARKRCSKRKAACEFLVGDVLKASFDKKFDFVFDRGCFHHIPGKSKPEYVKLVRGLLKEKGKFLLLCFSDKNPAFEKNLTKEDIDRYFSPAFKIHFIKDSVHREPPSGHKRYLYAVFMEKS